MEKDAENYENNDYKELYKLQSKIIHTKINKY